MRVAVLGTTLIQEYCTWYICTTGSFGKRFRLYNTGDVSLGTVIRTKLLGLLMIGIEVWDLALGQLASTRNFL